uniref:Breast cancer type 2 susceptibility protein isoform X1 n=1 Tax=Petromyzon marinus TaxID=7757 RepID=A0AAJ7WX27_PETMA|nr:breast cancer type 2 susceptibility protein isoform X1 [Petromyzon marinus]XP_032813350.1 breast cancer type 2 susceptibility protein isoform X1 [Petromyzon marinus]XP_032813351.1 breast cancer type 2 susceptibility protein isoform X1 [Petromyzon marinus]
MMELTGSQFEFTQACMPAVPPRLFPREGLTLGRTGDRLHPHGSGSAQGILQARTADDHQTDTTTPDEHRCRQEACGLETPPKDSTILSKQVLKLLSGFQDPSEFQNAHQSRFLDISKVSAWKSDCTPPTTHDGASIVSIKRYHEDFDIQFIQSAEQPSTLQSSYLKLGKPVQACINHRPVPAESLSKESSVSNTRSKAQECNAVSAFCEDILIENYPDNVLKGQVDNVIQSTRGDQGRNLPSSTIFQENREKRDRAQSSTANFTNEGGFQTAAGQTIVLSESAIQKGRSIFKDDINLNDVTEANDRLIQTSYNIDCSVENNAAQQNVKSHGSTNDKTLEPCLGFSVGSGIIINGGMLPLQHSGGFHPQSDLSFRSKYQSGKNTNVNVKLDTKTSNIRRSRNITAMNNCVATKPPCLTHVQADSGNTRILEMIPDKERSQLLENTSIQCIHKMGETTASDSVASENKREANIVHLEHSAHLANQGFQTASGKKVTINESSLKRAKELFEEFTVAGNEDHCRDNVNKRDDPPTRILPESSLDVFHGIGTVGGRGVTFENLPPTEDVKMGVERFSAAAEARVESDDDGKLNCTQNKTVMRPPLFLHKSAVHIKGQNEPGQQMDSLNNYVGCNNILESDNSVLNTAMVGFANCFSTASGKSIEVSEEALHNARKRLQEVDISERSEFIKNPIQSDIKQIENAVQRVPANLSDSFLSKSGTDAHCRVHSPENLSSPTVKATQLIPPVQFYTGRGSKVNISEESLEIAKRQLSKTTCEYRLPRILNADVAHVKRNTDRGSELPHGGKPQRAGGRLQGGANDGLVREALRSPGVAERERLSPRSPDSRVRQETEESVIAWLQDEDTDPASPHHLAAPLTPESPSLRAWAAPNAHQVAAKRPRHSESFPTGEPPLKRQLLSESDVGASAEPLLEPSVSSPDGFYEKRRRLPHGTVLRPSVSSPYCDLREQKQAAPAIDTRQQRQQGLAKGTASPSGAPHAHNHKAGAFLPPFRVSQPKALSAARGVRALSAGVHAPPSGGWFPDAAGRLTTLSGEPGVVGGDDKHAGGRCSPLTRREGAASPPPLPAVDAVGSAQWLARLESARTMQELRVSQKRGQAEHALPGGLLAARGAAPARVSLRSAVGGGTPGSYIYEQLLRYGVSAGVTDVRADTAEAFRFHCEQHFSWRAVCGGSGFRLADGGLLVPDHVGTAGKEEFYKALLDTPGVDPGLVDAAWAYNHYRWLVWKLAAMEVAFPAHFAGRCLTPEVVLLQLKFRYDVEVDGSKRSAIRKIVERDDVASRTLVLLVSKLTGADAASVPGPPGPPGPSGPPEPGLALELSDGWYALPALLDAPLAALTRQGRVRVGHKLIVHGAELVGAQEACPPLEAPPSLALKICANSTRRARWDARLGFYRNPGPFPLAVSSLLAHGGAVGCVDVVVLRVYPLQWMEKLASGGYVFRSERAEEREARRRSGEQQRALESLYARLENDLDERHKGRDRNKPRKSMAEIQALQDGAELYEAIRDSVDPCYVESCLSHEQARTLHSHRQGLADQKRTEMQAELCKALSSADGSSGGTQRDVCALWKLRVASYGDDRGRSHTAGNILSIWRPVPELHCLLREGLRFRIHHLAASQGRGHLDAGDVQLASSKKTKYQQMQASEALIGTIYQPRQAVAFFDLSLPDFWPPYSELDVVGIVISIQSLAGGGTQTVVLADEGRRLANVRIWGGLAAAAAEELVRPRAVLAITNLQWRPAGAPRAGTATPVLFAGELSSFSLNPKEQHLRHRHSALRAAVPDVKSFVQEVEEKLLGHGAQPEECRVALAEKPSPGSGGRLQRSGSGLQRSDSSAAAARASPASISLEKRKRSLSYLNGIPSLPPVSPLVATSTPVARRAFRAPRYVRGDSESSIGPSHANPHANPHASPHASPQANPPAILHIKPHAASPRPHTPPVSTPTNQSSSAHFEDEFPKDSVADEDLMMIDTQALLHKQTQGHACNPYKSAVQESDASLDAAAGKVEAAAISGTSGGERVPAPSGATAPGPVPPNVAHTA